MILAPATSRHDIFIIFATLIFSLFSSRLADVFQIATITIIEMTFSAVLMMILAVPFHELRRWYLYEMFSLTLLPPPSDADDVACLFSVSYFARYATIIDIRHHAIRHRCLLTTRWAQYFHIYYLFSHISLPSLPPTLFSFSYRFWDWYFLLFSSYFSHGAAADMFLFIETLLYRRYFHIFSAFHAIILPSFRLLSIMLFIYNTKRHYLIWNIHI